MNVAHPVLVWLPTAAIVAVGMELWAACLHRRVWHAALWAVHRSHHAARPGAFERNDVLSALHAPIAIAAVLYGCAGHPGLGRELAFGVGVGMTGFGLGYAIVHDGLVHGRFPVRVLLRFRYLRDVARAHRVHHARAAAGGAPFGLFLGPWELARHHAVTRRAARASAPRSAPSGRPRAGRGRASPSARPAGDGEP